MEDYFCEYLALEFRFSSEDFDKEAFLNDAEIEDRSNYSSLFGSLEKPNQEHASINMRFLKGKKSRLTIVYHKADFEVNDVRPPYMEDCAQWIGQFFKNDEMTVKIRMVFNYNKKYTPIFSLPFPLITESKELSGSMVSGVSIELPLSTRLERAVIQKTEGNTVVIATASDKIKLTSFDLSFELDKRSTPIRKLLKKVGEEDDSESGTH